MRNRLAEDKYITNELYPKLTDYGKSNYYPFHMPGHKRNSQYEISNPVSMDITEITDFDNLHHAEGILLQEQQYAAKLYGASKSFFLVNGSTCGILAAISASVKRGGKILICRNAHKSVYNAAYLRQLELFYLEAEQTEIGLCLPVTPSAVESALRKTEGIGAVLITSPTYEGMSADICGISAVVHDREIPLIVDEAHGAHFGFHDYFPDSAITCGADIVIQSMHKTLPSLTQTALLHIGRDADQYVSETEIERFLGIYQTSSPSYVFMGAMSKCLHSIDKEQFEKYALRLEEFYRACEELRHVHLYVLQAKKQFGKDEIKVHQSGQNINIYEQTTDKKSSSNHKCQDLSKLVIYTDDKSIDGQRLFECLRDKYHLECEMAAPRYVLAMTSLCDTDEGFARLFSALKEIDDTIKESLQNISSFTPDIKSFRCETQYTDMQSSQKKTTVKRNSYPVSVYTIADAVDFTDKETVEIEHSIGRISAEFIYCYPPGSPIIVPGERMRETDYAYIMDCKKRGLNVQGLEDYSCRNIKVIKET